MHSNQLGRSNPSRWGDLMWELSSEEFLSFKHWKDSNDIYHLLWAHCVADNVLSIYYLFTFLNPQKKTIWDYFPFWGKRPEVRASQLISDKAEIKSQGYPKLHRPCALKFHTSPQSLNSNACKGQSYWEWGLQTGNHSVASLLSFVNSLLIEIWVPIVFHHKKKKAVMNSWCCFKVGVHRGAGRAARIGAPVYMRKRDATTQPQPVVEGIWTQSYQIFYFFKRN